MPRFKPIHQGLKLLPVDFDKQVQPGSFEYALCQLIDHELDLSAFHARYKNDLEGAPAYDPAVLLKLILLAYSRGIVSSRKIEAACRENVVFIAVSGDSQPNFTTLAAFVSELGDLAAKLFAQVLTVCDRQGLIGREMFAIDGVKLPSNAGKAKSGTRADYRRQLEKMEKAAKKLLAQHREADAVPPEPDAQRQARKLERLQKEAKQLRDWLEAHPQDRKGSKGSVRFSNRTDNDSAKMATRQVTYFQGKADPEHDPVEVMKRRIDSDRGRAMITWRFQTVEPVFGNTRGNKRLDRFTLRGQPKVDGQWKLYCLVHNIEKLAKQGYAG